MQEKAKIRAEAERLVAQFCATGAEVVEADILQPAETLLDLYGEDIRARAYVTHDPMRGEMMLRPDFTVPLAQLHMENRAKPARYTYMGEVFRKQEYQTYRPVEYLQVGYEVFDEEDRAKADAEVFAGFSKLLDPLGLKAATGDIGIILAAVRSLSTTETRKAALLRHIWRPRRFRALLDRYSGRSDTPEARLALIEAVKRDGAEAVLNAAGPEVGLRSRAEVIKRLENLEEDTDVAPLSSTETDILEHLLSIRNSAPVALGLLLDIAVDLPALSPSIDAFEARLSALDANGVDVDQLEFETSYGRTTLEYYDGFVFGFYSEAHPELSPVATGGRYDALTAVLGQGRGAPAVGGVIRPELLLALREKEI